MKGDSEHLEVLTTSIKFFKSRESRLANLVAQANVIGSMFLTKRERLDSDEFPGSGFKRARGLSDATLPEYKIASDADYNRFRQRKSSVLMIKDLPGSEDLEIQCEKEELVEITEKPETVQENKKRKENDGFDFGVPKNKKKKDTKFVFKVDKTTEDLSLNDKGRGKLRRTGEDDDRLSSNSFIKQDEVAIEDIGDRQQGVLDEKQKLKIKMAKVNTYWDKRSLLIPNVFRLARLIDEDAKNLLEFQDYSKKSVLVQGQGQSQKKSSDSKMSDDIGEADFNEDVEFTHRRSFNIILDHPEDMPAFY